MRPQKRKLANSRANRRCGAVPDRRWTVSGGSRSGLRGQRPTPQCLTELCGSRQPPNGGHRYVLAVPCPTRIPWGVVQVLERLLCRVGLHYVWRVEERRVCQRCGAAWDDWSAIDYGVEQRDYAVPPVAVTKDVDAA